MFIEGDICFCVKITFNMIYFYYFLVKREESKKLPPGRVGAKFDHSGSASSQWLPSFGRVWNTGRRQQSA